MLGESIADFMARRRREEAERDEAEHAGRHAWASSTRSGQNLPAAKPVDVHALGVARRGTSSNSTSGRSDANSGASYGALRSYAPSPEKVAETHRQQAEIADARRNFDHHNWGLPAFALAPIFVAGAAELADLAAARVAAAASEGTPLVLTKKDPYMRVGDNWSTRAGNRAHAQMRQRVKAKDDWESEPPFEANGRVLRPDVMAPPRPSRPDKPRFMELKPNTPTGRKAGERAIRKYKQIPDSRTRVIYYDPKDYM